MTSVNRPRGVYSPVVTPFTKDLLPDHDRYVRIADGLSNRTSDSLFSAPTRKRIRSQSARK